MKALFKSALFILAVLLSTSSGLAQRKRGPSTSEERGTAVKAARLLEADPFRKEAKKMRDWFTLWLIEVPGSRGRGQGPEGGVRPAILRFSLTRR